MAYGDTASAYGRGEANGGGWAPSRGIAVGNSGGPNYVYRSIPGGGAGSMGNWNTGGNIVGFGSMAGGIHGVNVPRTDSLFGGPPAARPSVPVSPIIDPVAAPPPVPPAPGPYAYFGHPPLIKGNTGAYSDSYFANPRLGTPGLGGLLGMY